MLVAGWNLVHPHALRRREPGRAAVALVRIALHEPLDLAGMHAELVLQRAARPDRPGLLILRHADALAAQPAGVVIPESLRTMMLVWKNRRMVNTGIATQRVSPRAVAMMSDDIDISEMSNSAKRNCRQNISDGWIIVGTSSMPCGTRALRAAAACARCRTARC